MVCCVQVCQWSAAESEAWQEKSNRYAATISSVLRNGVTIHRGRPCSVAAIFIFYWGVSTRRGFFSCVCENVYPVPTVQFLRWLRKWFCYNVTLSLSSSPKLVTVPLSPSLLYSIISCACESIYPVPTVQLCTYM